MTDKWKKLTSQKESLYSALKDIEFDYGLGKLSKDDYEELKKTYKVKASTVLKQLDDIGKDSNITSLEEEVEKEINAIRKLKKERNENDNRIGYDINEEITQKIILNCEECGKEYSPQDNFCSQCGHNFIDNEYSQETTKKK
ncbi:MAG: zinc ribbon domain-containing protein [Thermodesulfobacteriota bacterium]